MTNTFGLLNINNLSINCGFGLEYYLQGNFEKADRLLRDGIRFCEIIETGSNIIDNGSILNILQLESWNAFEVLIKHTTPDKLKVIIKESDIIKNALIEMINHRTQYTESEIRKMQHFFNETGGYYLAVAMRTLKCRYR